MIITTCKLSYNSKTVPPIIMAVQGDTGRSIKFEIADYTIPVGATATYYIRKPSGESIYNSGTISGNAITCDLTAQSLAEAGENNMQVRIIQDEEVVTSFDVILMVRPFRGIDAIESGTEMNIFDQAVQAAAEDFQEQAEGIVEEVIESIPADYTALSNEVSELNERIDNVKADLLDLERHGYPMASIEEAVNAWADEHDTEIMNAYVTPEQYGAVGDGVTDDSSAIATASQHGIVFGANHTYYIGSNCNIVNDIIACKFVVNKNNTMLAKKAGLKICDCEFSNDDYYPSTGRGNWILDLQESDGAVISNCYFHKGVTALYLDRLKNVIISNNIFADFRQMASSGGNGYGILCVECINLSIIGNIFHNVARHSIYISHDPTSTYCEDILIKNNLFKWDSAVVGNTTGFEETISIRPAKRVVISNNDFIDMFSICGITHQDITVGGGTVYANSEDIYIKNNRGSFNNTPRPSSSGVIYLPTSQDHNAPCKNLIIDGNDFKINSGAFVAGDTYDGMTIINNRLRFNTYSASIIVYSANASAVSDVKNIRIINNDINAQTLFSIPDMVKDVGEVTIFGNIMKITNIGSVKVGSTFGDVTIVNNVINTDGERAYLSSSVVDSLMLKGNASTKTIALYLNAAGKPVYSTDPCFRGYGYNTSNPTSTVTGSMHIVDDGTIRIVDKSGTWHQLTVVS